MDCSKIIDDYLTRLPETEERVIRMIYGLSDGMPRALKLIADVLQVTPERVRQIRNRALRRLRHPRNTREFRPLLSELTDAYEQNVWDSTVAVLWSEALDAQNRQAKGAPLFSARARIRMGLQPPVCPGCCVAYPLAVFDGDSKTCRLCLLDRRRVWARRTTGQKARPCSVPERVYAWFVCYPDDKHAESGRRAAFADMRRSRRAADGSADS